MAIDEAPERSGGRGGGRRTAGVAGLARRPSATWLCIRRLSNLCGSTKAHLFHISSLPPKLYESLLAEFDEEDLPRNAYFGDGSPIEIAALEEVRRVYQQETITFPWQEGDILMLDNMLTAHARAPFVGRRKIVVGMAESSRQ